MPRVSLGEELLAEQLRQAGVAFEREYRFAPPRRWRFDFRLNGGIAVEVEGGRWVAGKNSHGGGIGFAADLEKYNEAALRGWKVLRVTTEQVNDGSALALVRRALT